MQKNDARTSVGWDIVVAGSLLTRLPLPHAPSGAFDHQARAVWAYPVWGAVIGVLSLGSGLVVHWATGHEAIAAGAVLLMSVILTGGMHEDGLADCADGFWGGFTRARRLEIMKDSQIGSYGVLALVLFLGLRWLALADGMSAGWGYIVAAAALSRGVMPLLMRALPHARAEGLSRSVGKPPLASVVAALVLGIVLCALFYGGAWLAGSLAALSVVLIAGLVARAKIGGQTGDTLGAVQVISETLILIVLVT